MEERCTVNSPRRILSFSKNRKPSSIFHDVDERPLAAFGVSREHGPKLSEVYGFVGAITTVVFTAVFLIWAYVPDRWLHSVGIYYYPSSIAAHTLLLFENLGIGCAYLCNSETIALATVFYVGMNFKGTPPPTFLNSMFDEFSREPLSATSSSDDEVGNGQPIKPISDIGIHQINRIMFKDVNQ